MLNQLFYSGPSIDVLHEEYAKKGRIDARAPVGAAREIRIEAPVGRVWELLVNVPAWGTWDRAVHDVHLDSTVAADARFTWVNGRARIRSRFAVVDPGRELTWTGVSTG
ncbi:MAG TPA: SRPBCC family protein, partial [Propionibacteriaceae bacterium]|nr:SRPBCC family protein [Propionibacteriaceae bacterium]